MLHSQGGKKELNPLSRLRSNRPDAIAVMWIVPRKTGRLDATVRRRLVHDFAALRRHRVPQHSKAMVGHRVVGMKGKVKLTSGRQ